MKVDAERLSKWLGLLDQAELLVTMTKMSPPGPKSDDVEEAHDAFEAVYDEMESAYLDALREETSAARKVG